MKVYSKILVVFLVGILISALITGLRIWLGQHYEWVRKNNFVDSVHLVIMIIVIMLVSCRLFPKEK